MNTYPANPFTGLKGALAGLMSGGLLGFLLSLLFRRKIAPMLEALEKLFAQFKAGTLASPAIALASPAIAVPLPAITPAVAARVPAGGASASGGAPKARCPRAPAAAPRRRQAHPGIVAAAREAPRPQAPAARALIRPACVMRPAHLLARSRKTRIDRHAQARPYCSVIVII
jgi:hypothetical protein